MIILPIGFRHAKRVLHQSNYKIKVGAVILSKYKTIVSVGYNTLRTHPKFANGEDTSFTLHAETTAIIKANYCPPIGSSLFVYRELASGLPGLAKPCNDCMDIILRTNIEFLYYTTNESPYYEKVRLCDRRT